MKEKSSFLHAMLVYVVTAMCFCVTSCGDDPEAPDFPAMSTHKGDVEFDIRIPDGNGSGNASSPAVVNPGETFNISITQKSSYTDPDGSVYTCDPKASVTINARLDTVYAKDLSALTRVKNGYVKTNKTRTSPVVNQTLQTFEIGGQSIVFDLSHEVFTHINSKKESVEMPYIKLKPAELGNKAATEEKPQGRSSIAVTGVTVRPLPATRGAVIRDTTMYEVNVRFNLEVESVNTTKNEKQSLEFSVNYVGGVETVTELKDPVGDLSYAWDVKSGTSDMASPFVSIPGKVMEVWMTQNSTYTDAYGNVASGSPVAKIAVTTARDTVWVSTVDELNDIIDRTGNILAAQSAQQKFGSKLQEIVFDWSYEESEAMIAGETVPMPYYTLEPVKFKDLSVKELNEAMVDGKECQLYEVSAKFSQKAIPKNETEKSADVEIEYIVKYIGAMEIKMVMVEYFPGGYWQDPHDNMPLSFYAHVERYRTYSNGKRVGPDRFEDYGHYPDFAWGGYTLEGYYMNEAGYWMDGGPYTVTVIGDSTLIVTHSIRVSNVGPFNYETAENEYTEGGLGVWSMYYPSNELNDERFDIGKGVYCPVEYEEDSRPNGWYYRRFRYRHSVWARAEQGKGCSFRLSHGLYFYDQFLVIDGRIIDFSKLWNIKEDFNISEQTFLDQGKKGKIVKAGMDFSYLGKNFHSEEVDSVYVEK